MAIRWGLSSSSTVFEREILWKHNICLQVAFCALKIKILIIILILFLFFYSFYFQVCPINRKSVEVYASSQCEAWSKILGEGVLTGEGRQVVHQPVKGNWLSWAVFCKMSSETWHSSSNKLDNLKSEPQTLSTFSFSALFSANFERKVVKSNVKVHSFTITGCPELYFAKHQVKPGIPPVTS